MPEQFFSLVLCGSGFFASKREMALGVSLGRWTVTHPENQQTLFPFPWLLDTCPITRLLLLSFVRSLFVLRYAFVLEGNFDTTKS